MMWRSWQRPGLRRKQSNMVDSRSWRDIASEGRQKYCGTEESRPTFFSACRQSSSADHCRRLLLKNLELLMAPAGERDMSNDLIGLASIGVQTSPS